MKKFDIYVDSGANIPYALVKKHDIHVISYVISVNGEERLCYEENIAFEETAKKFYEDMRAGAEVKTSLLNSEKFVDALSPSLESGKDVLLFTISSGISATNQQANFAKEKLEKQFPERSVFVIDSANASMGEGMLALKAADLRDIGESAETAAKWATEHAYQLNSYLTVGDLKYLKKTGRISTTLAIAGTLLNIKPVLRADGGDNAKIVFFNKTRGRKKALQELADAYRTKAANHEDQTVAICHCDCEEDALALADMIREIGVKDIIIEYYDLCTGSHVGPGTVALFFYGKDRRVSFFPSKEKQPVGAVVPNKI